MRIIPAIDIIDGRCVRLKQGDYNQKKIYAEDPLDAAKAFEDAGIEYLHVVDLDGAKSKSIKNHKTLERIVSNTKLKVDFGGGIKTDHDINIAFESGAVQVTCGSIAVNNPTLVKSWIEQYGSGKIILGADVRGEHIAIQGWKEQTTTSIYDLLDDYSSAGIEYCICTDIATDGMLSGPSIELYRKLMNKYPDIKFVASGGVSNVSDIDELLSLKLDGAIIGTAIYEGTISLSQLSNYVD